MISKISDLSNKTEELERYIKNVEKQQNQLKKQSTCESFIKNYSNLEVVGKRNVFITQIGVISGEKLFFQCLIDLSIVSSDYVYFSLIANGICIQKNRKKLQSGSSQITILQNFEPLETEDVDIYLQISTKNETLLTVGQVSLFVWGSFENKISIDYQILETENSYLLSFVDNNILYYKFTEKITGEYSFLDFESYGSAISYSFVYLPNSKKLFLFFVDVLKNLYYMNFEDKNLIFLESNISFVGADSSDSDEVLITIVKDNCCFYFEMNENFAISSQKKLDYDKTKIISCFPYFDEYNREFYIILTGKNNDNYLVKCVNDEFKTIENISSNYLISIEVYDAGESYGN